MLACAVPAAAHPPPFGLLAHPAPTSYPDQLHPVDVRDMAESLIPPDPCLWADCAALRTAARVRIQAAFPEKHWDRAWRVARCECGDTWHPWIENYDQFRRETGRKWTPERARYVPVDERRGWKVYGIFQHRWQYWADRTGRAYPGENLDPFDPWHNTLMGAWVAYNEPGGWLHYDCYKRLYL